MDIYIECPHCNTRYTAARCGIALKPNESADATVVCVLCKQEFDASIEFIDATRTERQVTVSTPNWFQRVVLRKEPVVQTVVDETANRHDVTTRKR